MDWLARAVIIVFVVGIAGVVWQFVVTTIIQASTTGLRYRDGRFADLLSPGRYLTFDPFRRTKIVVVSTIQHPPTIEVPVTSSDQFSFKITLAPVITVTDARAFHESLPVPAADAYVYPGLEHAQIQRQIAAAAIIVTGKSTLAEILADPAQLPTAMMTALDGQMPGMRIDQLLVTAVNLPPETRKMFTEVERAKLEALAGIERARGEQAAMRVLANAARSMNDNPALANLRLLKAIETSKGPTTIVLGQYPASMPPG
jgi:regulator of protease activity HflC (stomatin/prohibitin superfamily)